VPQAQTPPAAKANFGDATYFGAPVATVVATDSVSVNADCDNGGSALHSCLGSDGKATMRVVA